MTPALETETGEDARNELKIAASIGLTRSTRERTGQLGRGDRDERTDAVAPALTLNYTETAGQFVLGPAQFGNTGMNHTTALTGIAQAGNTINLTAEHKHELDITVKPSDADDVSSANSAAITEATYQAAYRDLYPNGIGKPPRAVYWNSAIVKAHEKLHKQDSVAATAGGIQSAKSWLEKQKVPDGDADAKRASVEGLLVTANQKIRDADNDDYWGSSSRTTPHDERAGELRAYAAGKPQYVTLATAIRTRGRKEGWAGAKELRPY